MIEIPCGPHIALVDPEDAELVSGYTWSPHQSGNGRGLNLFYARTNVRGEDGRRRSVQMHRLIMDAGPEQDVDHRNHNGLDNRRANLRVATESQNMGNARIYSTNTSGYKGVTRNKHKWNARIQVNGRLLHLGYFTDIEDAARAYDVAALAAWGEYANVNFPDRLLPNDLPA